MVRGKKRHHPEGHNWNNSVTKRLLSRQVFADDGFINNNAFDSSMHMDEHISVLWSRYGHPHIGSEASSGSMVGDSCIDASSTCASTSAVVSEDSTPTRIQSIPSISDGGVKFMNSRFFVNDNLRSGWPEGTQSAVTSNRNNNFDTAVSSYLMAGDELSEGSVMQFARYTKLQGKIFVEVRDESSKGEYFSFSGRQLSVDKKRDSTQSAISTIETSLLSISQSVSDSDRPMTEECSGGKRFESTGDDTLIHDLGTGLLPSDWVGRSSISQGDCELTSETIIILEDSSTKEKHEELGRPAEEASAYIAWDAGQAFYDHLNRPSPCALGDENGQSIVVTVTPRYVLSSGRLSMEEAQLGRKAPTIDQEFEEYFAGLML